MSSAERGNLDMKKFNLILTFAAAAALPAFANSPETKNAMPMQDNDHHMSRAFKPRMGTPGHHEDRRGRPHPGRRNAVFCDIYRNERVSGFSLFRERDGTDLGNAVWNDARHECDSAARVANEQRAGIACSRFYNKTNNTTSYSVYRIADNKDLGKATIGNFEDCQSSVKSARDGIFCSTYIKNGETWWSMYEIRTNQDIGANVYTTLEKCEEQY
jgi:hypothetical protein